MRRFIYIFFAMLAYLVFGSRSCVPDAEKIPEEIIVQQLKDSIREKSDAEYLSSDQIKAFEKQAKSVLSLFKEREQKIDSWKFDDDQVTIAIKYHAVLSVDLPNGMKAGDELNLTGLSEFIFEGDKIMSIIDKS